MNEDHINQNGQDSEGNQRAHRQLVPTASTDLSAQQTNQDPSCADDSEVHSAGLDPATFVEMAQRHRMKPGLARTFDKEYRRALGSAVTLYYEIRHEPNRDDLLRALKEASGDTSRTTDAMTIILNFLINYGGSDGRQYRSRDRKIMAFMIELEKHPNEVPNFIMENGGLRACAKMYRDHKKSKDADGVATDGVQLPRTLSALVPDILSKQGDRALALTHLSQCRGKRVEIEQAIRIPALSAEELDGLWKQIKCLVDEFARGARTTSTSSI